MASLPFRGFTLNSVFEQCETMLSSKDLLVASVLLVICSRMSHTTFPHVLLEGSIIEVPPRCHWLLRLGHQLNSVATSSNIMLHWKWALSSVHYKHWVTQIQTTHWSRGGCEQEVSVSSVGKLCSTCHQQSKPRHNPWFGQCSGPKYSTDISP